MNTYLNPIKDSEWLVPRLFAFSDAVTLSSSHHSGNASRKLAKPSENEKIFFFQKIIHKMIDIQKYYCSTERRISQNACNIAFQWIYQSCEICVVSHEMYALLYGNGRYPMHRFPPHIECFPFEELSLSPSRLFLLCSHIAGYIYVSPAS